MSKIIETIRDRVRARGFSEQMDLAEVEDLIRTNESSEMLVLLGDLIQLLELPGGHTLEEAERAYLRAQSLAPTEPEPHLSLGHFYDAVMDDPAKAKQLFERAVALGSEEAANALREVEAQLRAV